MAVSGCSGCVQLEGVAVDLRGKCLGRCFIDFARISKGISPLQLRFGTAVFVIIAVAECLDDAAVIVRAAQRAAGNTGVALDADIAEMIACVRTADLMLPIQHAHRAELRLRHPVTVMHQLVMPPHDCRIRVLCSGGRICFLMICSMLRSGKTAAEDQCLQLLSRHRFHAAVPALRMICP